jgi:UDP-3-O-acyl N-acetylglucosamine deacetylase
MSKCRVLIVDDETNVVQTLTTVFRDKGFEVSSARDGEQALRLVHMESPDVVLLDIWLPGMDGIETLQVLQVQYPDIKVIVMSGHGNIKTAVKATQLGAIDYLEKPLSIESLLLAVHQALRPREQGGDAMIPRSIQHHSPCLVGESLQMQRLHAQLEQARHSDAPVLIQGEEGSGKTLVARLLHYGSDRCEGPFIRCNCASLTPHNAARMLFGCISVLGERRNVLSKGYVELANGGLLFLDQIDALSFAVQQQLLQAMQTSTITRVGGKISIPLNIRVVGSCTITGTHTRQRLLPALRDLLQHNSIATPPLREHPDDIPALTQHFIQMYGNAVSKTFDHEAMTSLLHYHWPGNVNELKTLVMQMVNTISRDCIRMSDIPLAIRESRVSVQDAHPTRSLADAQAQYDGKARVHVNHQRRNHWRSDEVKPNFSTLQVGGQQEAILAEGKPTSSLSSHTACQRTLRRGVVIYGQGLHSGLKTGMILSPLPPNSGIIFSNIPSGETLPASIDFVESTDFCTSLQKGRTSARTIEHIMSVLHAYRISNLLIKISDEIPIMDGSATAFCQLIEESGVVEQNYAVEEFVVDQCYHIGDILPEAKYIQVEPYDGLRVSYRLHYPKPLGIQEITYEHQDGASYQRNIAPARTFAFLRDVEQMHAAGLVAGGRFNNVILIDDEKIVNSIQLRFPDEFARHKILDILGDFYLLGRPLRGHIRANMTGHTENIALVRKLRAILQITQA